MVRVTMDLSISTLGPLPVMVLVLLVQGECLEVMIPRVAASGILNRKGRLKAFAIPHPALIILEALPGWPIDYMMCAKHINPPLHSSLMEAASWLTPR